jgi:uncharacterized protein (TIGR04255 family)
MDEALRKLHFPADIKLESSPLLEAWLEIRWRLQRDAKTELIRDPGFAFALGVFYKSVEDPFGYREDLEASHAPEDMVPYVVRHRFRPGKGEWPLLQLGPGVATVNFTEPYTWDDFKEKAVYLRNKLLDAYGESGLGAQRLALRYRNGVPFRYGSNNLLDFLDQNLNTSVTLPVHIPGPVSSANWPTSANIVLTFDLQDPRGTGTLRLGTGTRTQQDPKTGQETKDEMLIWQLEVASKGDDAPELVEEDEFTRWLTSAHVVIHEWFFSLLDGPLFKHYKGEVRQPCS